jgi:ribosomal protein L7/L12
VAELAIGISILALIVAVMALSVASSAARAADSGPRANVLRQPGSPAQVADGEVSAGVMDLLRAGKKIEAIKQYRIETGAGLLEAKEAVESLERSMQ